MNRIDTAFQKLKKNQKKAFITFITAGDPDIDTTYDLVLEMIAGGVDIIELGVPFSDPIAEGPVIQKASERALKNGLLTDDIFGLVKKLREKTETPILLMLYINSIYGYGTERFFTNCRIAGIDGLIVPDMPFEEKEELQSAAKKENVAMVSLVAPTSQDRIGQIVKEAEGFLYCVSSMGVTGQRSGFSTDFETFFKRIRSGNPSIPTAIGFGISNAAQAKELSQYADGVIIGSAIVQIIERHGKESVPFVKEYISGVRRALDA